MEVVLDGENDDVGVGVGVGRYDDGGDPHGSRFFAVIPAVMAVGGVAIIVAAVVVAAAASLLLLLSLS